MPKAITQPVGHSDASKGQKDKRHPQANERLSGSKKVKNQNHSRQNHGEGS